MAVQALDVVFHELKRDMAEAAIEVEEKNIWANDRIGLIVSLPFFIRR